MRSHSSAESEGLGISVARVLVPRSALVDPDSVADAVTDLDSDLTIVRVSATHALLQAQLAQRLPQHRILHADTLVYWHLRVAPARSPEEQPVETPAVEVESLAALVGDVFDGYQNHYSANPYLQSIDVAKVYATLAVQHAISGQPYCLVERDGRSVAVATLSVAAEHLEVVLAGVASAYRGRGVYRALLEAIDSFARRSDLELVVISTQVQNTAVQRSWARFGFLPVAAFSTLHVMGRNVA